jgi:hypothetical protein
MSPPREPGILYGQIALWIPVEPRLFNEDSGVCGVIDSAVFDSARRLSCDSERSEKEQIFIDHFMTTINESLNSRGVISAIFGVHP